MVYKIATTLSEVHRMNEQKYNLDQSKVELDKLFDLSTKGIDKTACEDLAEKARIIYEQYPESEDIALWYAGVLVNLSVEQVNIEELGKTIHSVQQIFEQFNQSEEIALRYAMILFDLSTVQTELKERKATAEKLEKLLQQFQDSHDIALPYAMILVNLSTKQTVLKELETTVEKLEKLQQQFQDSPDIALRYAMILVNLSINQIGLKEIEATVEKLEKLQQQFPESHDIAEAFARILANLSDKQPELKERAATAENLQVLQQQFPESHDIAEMYAMTLFNLSTKQTELNELVTTAKKLKGLHKHERFQESEEIAFIYAVFLASLFEHQTELSERLQTIETIKTLYDKFSEFMIQNFDDLFFSNDNVCDSEEYMLFNFILREGLLKNTKYAILQTWAERYKEDSNELKNLLSIYQYVQKIKYQLGLKNEDKNKNLKFGHYTKGSVLQSLLVQKEESSFSIVGKTRLNNANYMNDPEEGIIIEKILGLDRRDALEPSSWFLMSFTIKTDDLAM